MIYFPQNGKGSQFGCFYFLCITSELDNIIGDMDFFLSKHLVWLHIYKSLIPSSRSSTEISWAVLLRLKYYNNSYESKVMEISKIASEFIHDEYHGSSSHQQSNLWKHRKIQLYRTSGRYRHYRLILDLVFLSLRKLIWHNFTFLYNSFLRTFFKHFPSIGY